MTADVTVRPETLARLTRPVTDTDGCRVNHALVARLRTVLGAGVPVGSALHLHLAHWDPRRATVAIVPSSRPGCRTVAVPALAPRLTLHRRSA